jgi:Replication-relaxation
MDALAFQPRGKRFNRRTDAKPIVLTARDLNHLARVARHRFLTSAQLAALDGGSPQNVVRALRLLFDHGYLDRPASHLVMVPLQGTRPLVYALGQRGARALRAHGYLVKDRVDWTEKNKHAGAVFIEHTLEIADFMVRLELACRQRDDIELIRAGDIIAAAPEATRRAREPLRWQVEQIERGRKVELSVVPDGLFALRFVDDTASYFLLEVDRGTIPLRRTDREGSAAWRKNIAYKLATYYEGWREGRHVEQFGVKQVRVLMLTNSAARMNNMLSIVDELTEGKGTGFFLFTARERLTTNGPLTAEWVNGRGEAVRLLD